MKLLPILLLAFVLILGVACSSEPAVPPTATPDVPKYSSGEVIGLVQGMLRAHPDRSCNKASQGKFLWHDVNYRGEGGWDVTLFYRESFRWYVYEGSNAVQAVDGPC